MNIKAKFVAAIEKTNDPLAPIKLEDAYKSCNALGLLMANIGNKEQTIEFSNTLLKGFPDEMDHIAADPNFIGALAGLLTSALVAYGRSL